MNDSMCRQVRQDIPGENVQAKMFDLHSHILPSIDDGANDVDVSLEMARMYKAQGVRCVTCTPHILPGVYANSGPAIRQAVASLQNVLEDAGVDLELRAGADNHIVPDFVDGLHRGHLLSIGDTRYVLVEPPHHVMPPRLEDLLFSLIVAGFVPVVTHPERLTWIDDHYATIVRLVERGVWMQITSGALVGRFGRRAKFWGERMLCEGVVHILATDAHNTERRPPDLDQGRRAAEQLIGVSESDKLVVLRPEGVLGDVAPDALWRFDMADSHRNALGDRDVFPSVGFTHRGGIVRRLRRFFGH